MKNKEASSGVIAGTAVEIILRIINDMTPFGSYTCRGLGMGDYQMQSFVTPQVLVDPYNSATIAIPPGWAPTTVVAAAAGNASGGMIPSRHGRDVRQFVRRLQYLREY